MRNVVGLVHDDTQEVNMSNLTISTTSFLTAALLLLISGLFYPVDSKAGVMGWHGMMHGEGMMMDGMWMMMVVWILVVIVLLLGAAALIKYLFSKR
jgi:hypothetical protein